MTGNADCCARTATGQASRCATDQRDELAPLHALPRDDHAICNPLSLALYDRAASEKCHTTGIKGQCPLWVISGHSAMSTTCPLYPQKRTFAAAVGMSALYQ
jgi:hypothetical protein